MPKNIPAGYAEITFHFTGNAHPTGAVTTLGILGPIPAPQAALTTLEGYCQTLHAAVAATSSSITLLEMKLGPSATGPTFTEALSAPGAQGAQGVPPNVALLVRKVPANLSSRFAGRMFWPGIEETLIGADGLVNGAAQTQFTNAFNTFYNSIDANIGQPVLFPASGGAPRLIDSFSVQPRIATQRRRNRR